MAHKYVAGGGSVSPKLVVLLPSPTWNDTEKGRLLSDSREFDAVCRDAHVPKESLWITSVSKYYVPENTGGKKIPFDIRAKNAGIDIQAQIDDLRKELHSIKPACILAIGGPSLWALSGKTNITNYRGSILHSGMGFKFVPSYNPTQLGWSSETKVEFKGYWNRAIMVHDFGRAWKQAQFKEYRVPSRHLEICKTLADAYRFFEHYALFKDAAADIEAMGTCFPACIGFAFNKHHGMTFPLWNKDGMCGLTDNEMVRLWYLIAKVLNEKGIIGQNFNYDRDKILRLGFSVPHFKSDVMLKGFAINPELPKRLAFNQSIYTEEPFYKDEGMYQGSKEDLFLGCSRDSCVTYEINDAMDPDLDEMNQRGFYENFLMKLPDLYWEIERNGFHINTEIRDTLMRKYVEWDERLRYELFEIVGTEINVNSPKQVPDLLFNTLNCPKRPGTGEEELTSLLNLQSFTDPTKRRVIELILEDRRVRKSISTYLMALPDYDGKMKTTCFPCLETGRSSNGQQEPPIRPTIEVRDDQGKKKKKSFGIAFQTMTKHGDIGSDIRSMYVPGEGEVFVNIDSSQAEARVIFLLANDEQALFDIDHHDYHALTASWFFGGKEEDYSKKILGYESPTRFAGKTLRHAGHLGAGKRRAAISVNNDARKYGINLKITEAQAETALRIFHSRQPKIQQVFQKGIVDSLQKSRILTAALPWGVDAPCGGKRMFYERWGEELNRQAYSYIPQRSVSDNTKAAGIRIKKQFPECQIIAEAHDALLFAVRREYLDDFTPLIKREMERPINFSACTLSRRSLKIPSEVEIGENYMDLKKYRVPEFNPHSPLYMRNQLTVEEKLTQVDIPPDTKLDKDIYNAQTRKFMVDY